MRSSQNLQFGLAGIFVLCATAGPSRGQSMQIVSPAPCEIVPSGDLYTISWTSDGYGPGQVQFGVEGMFGGYCNGQYWDAWVDYPVGSALTEDGHLAWQVPPEPIAGCRCGYELVVQPYSLRIPFCIRGTKPTPQLLTPAERATLSAGQEVPVTWTTPNATGSVEIALFREGSVVHYIGSAPAATGIYHWRVCEQDSGTEYSLRIYHEDPCGGLFWHDYSGPFTIVGLDDSPVLTSPNGGETLHAGTTQSITWNPYRFSGTVDLALLRNGQQVAYLGAVPAAAGSFEWRICDLLEAGDDYSVAISGHSCTGFLQDTCDTPFSIAGPTTQVWPTFELTAPVDGELWTPGSVQSVAWTSTDPVGDILVRLYRGTDSHSLTVAPMSAGAAQFIVPADIATGGGYRVALDWVGCGGELQRLSPPIGIGWHAALLPDFDGDEHIDRHDYAPFANCWTGPGILMISADCYRADLDLDNDVDQTDFSLFQRCFRGDKEPIDPSCLE